MSLLDILNHPATQCALLVAVLAVLLGVSFWGLRRYRDYIVHNQSDAGDLLTTYEEMHSQGVIDDAEYRTIKSRLNARLRNK
ncbi:MAG: hypothetical protein KY475_25360 [Planctomycetes bacterium]|nr:hypothetical protein [Planctomycetota bacterium]